MDTLKKDLILYKLYSITTIFKLYSITSFYVQAYVLLFIRSIMRFIMSPNSLISLYLHMV